MGGGIKIVDSRNIRINGGRFSGLDVGIDAENCTDLHLNGNCFERVRKPVIARRVNGLNAKGNVDYSDNFERADGLQMTRLAILVKEYMMSIKVN